MVEPAYQELLDKDIPRKTDGAVTVKIIAGESLGVKVNRIIEIRNFIVEAIILE